MKKVILSLASLLSVSIFACTANTPVSTESTKPATVTESTKPITTENIDSTKKDEANLGAKTDIKVEAYKWDAYNLEFSLPSNLAIKINKDDEFEAGNDSMLIQIFPWKDAKLTRDNVLLTAFTALTGIDKDSFVIDENLSGEVANVNGLNGYIIGGEAKQEGTPIYLGIFAAIDTTGSNNFISYIVFNKGKADENTKNINIGGDIFASFKKI